VPSTAFAEGVLRDGKPQVEVRLLADRGAIYSGATARVGLLFTLERGWHVYWRNPGQSGLATLIEWGFDGAEAGQLQWPAPEVFAESDGFLTTYGYSREVLLFTTAHFTGDLGDAVELAAEVDYLACEIQCVPGRAELLLRLPVQEADVAASPEITEIFDTYAARVPVSTEELGFQVEALYSQTAIRPGDAFEGAIALIAPEGVKLRPRKGRGAFVPDAVPGVELDVSGSVRHPLVESGMLVQFEGLADDTDPGSDQRLTGVVALRGGRDPGSWVEIDVAIPRAAGGASVAQIQNPWLGAPPNAAGVPFWRAVLLALLGGLILNLMPCVLPVLAIKVVGITELAHHSRREVISHGLAYTVGILVTMLALAATVVGLRLAGTEVGWGFQFQEPLFVAVIGAVLLLFALNLFGVFEIFIDSTALGRFEAQAVGLRRSFFEGLLAVVVATPCSAPFLGTAVGFAFASETPVIVGIFLAIGLGLASPYLLITLVPAWARWIPRSGGWMIRLRGVLGFALLGTVVWLLWLEGRYAGTEGMVGLLAFLLVVGFAAWVYGGLQRAGSTRMLLVGGLLAALIAAGGALTLPTGSQDPGSADTSGAITWQTYDQGEIASELSRGRVVFVDFTADWCITCKLNERIVFSSERVLSELERLNVATFKADWTRRDPVIRAELARHGRAGVPMYLVFDPAAPNDPAVLPELLTVDGFIAALRGASGGQYAISAEEDLAATSGTLESRL
jgi:thiol:disulfide interchange protein DsbD